MEKFGMPKVVKVTLKDLEDEITRTMAEKMGAIEKEKGFRALAEAYFDSLNIAPEYIQENRDQQAFQEMRHKLATEPGLIIANHPGYFDTAIIFKLVERSDIKVVVNERSFDNMAAGFGEEHFIKVGKSRDFIREVSEHIASGGVVLLYPTGGLDGANKDEPQFVFQEGLAVILKTMKPTDMIYSFNINRDDVVKINKERVHRIAGAASTFIVSEDLNLNNIKEPVGIRVDEACSEAGEWQNIVGSQSKETRSQALAEQYLTQFPER